MGSSSDTSSNSTYGSNQGQGTSGSSQYGQTGTSNSGSTGTSTYGQNNPSSTTSTYGQTGSSGQNSGSTYGSSSSSTADRSGSNMGQSGTASEMGAARAQGGSMDRSGSANVQHIRGRVSRVDQDNNSITLDRGLTLKVDDSTEIVGVDSANATGISALHEGQQVRASYDASSNSAKKIEVVGKKGNKKSMKSHSSSTSSDSSSIDSSSSDSSGTSKARIPNPNTAKTPAQSTTGGSDSEQKQ